MLYVLDTPVLPNDLIAYIAVDAEQERDFTFNGQIAGKMKSFLLPEQDRLPSFNIAFLIEDCRCFSSALLRHKPSPRYVWMPLHERIPSVEELCKAFTDVITVPIEIVTTAPYRVLNTDWNEGTRWVRVKDNNTTTINMSVAIIIARTLSIGFVEAFLKSDLESVTIGKDAEETVARWMQLCYMTCTRGDFLPGDLSISAIPVWMLPEEKFHKRINLFVEDPHPYLRDCIGWGFVMHYRTVKNLRYSPWSGAGNMQTHLKTAMYTYNIVYEANEYAKKAYR